MRVLLTGGTGFLGSHLVAALRSRGDECVVISRSGRDLWRDAGVTVVRGDPTKEGDWRRWVSGADAVVHLAGAPIVQGPRRWTRARKRVLVGSRVDAARHLAAALEDASPRPAAFISGSAIGYYGPRGDDIVDETDPPGSDFLGTLAVEWERAALEARDVARVVLLRTGIVLGRGGGAFDPLLPLFKLGLGGPWGDGRQWWSWIHVADHVGLVLHALDDEITGPLNLTAPNPVTVNEFARAMGRALRRPALLRAPAGLLRLVLGEAADAMLSLQRVMPRRALEMGYRFRFPTVDEALADILGR